MNDKITIRRWNITDELKTDEDIRYYLSSVLEDAEDDPAFVATVLSEITKDKMLFRQPE